MLSARRPVSKNSPSTAKGWRSNAVSGCRQPSTQLQRYPLVLDIHGGPNSAFYDAFNLPQQVLATAGFIVLAVNPRGSTTYGNAFTMAVLGDWGGEDYQDLMAAVDAVASRPYVDATRLGVHGYSYGGYMSSWIIGHTSRFKAAVVGAPCIDLPSMYGTSDIGVSFGEVQWRGTRWEALAQAVERSPLTYAPAVETPVLLLHGEADLRCPIEQGEQYFVALKRHGKEVEFVRFPDCSHLFLRVGHPKMREEYLRRMLGMVSALSPALNCGHPATTRHTSRRKTSTPGTHGDAIWVFPHPSVTMTPSSPRSVMMFWTTSSARSR